jgi:hypothetical protein
VTGQPAALPVQFVVVEVQSLVGLVGIAGCAHNDAAGAEQGADVPQEGTGGHRRAEEPDVVAQQQGAVEAARQPVLRGPPGVAEADAADAPLPAGLDRPRRGVQRGHLLTPALEFQRGPPGPGPDVNDAARQPGQRPLVPRVKPAQVADGVDADEPIVALDQDRPGPPRDRVQERPPEGVPQLRLPRCHEHRW